MIEDTMEKCGIEYVTPKAKLLAYTPLLIAEVAARTAYDSFSSSEHDEVRNFKLDSIEDLNGESSKLLNTLVWVQFHESVTEQLVMSIYFEDMGRGVLQEWARHRTFRNVIRSTRYTLSDILHIFFGWIYGTEDMNWVYDEFRKLSVLIIKTKWLFELEVRTIMTKLSEHYTNNKNDFLGDALSKENICYIGSIEADDSVLSSDVIRNTLNNGTGKRNAGDSFKYIVTDNFSVSGTINIDVTNFRKFLKLRDSGAAWFQMRSFAKLLYSISPEEYKPLLKKSKKVKE